MTSGRMARGPIWCSGRTNASLMTRAQTNNWMSMLLAAYKLTSTINGHTLQEVSLCLPAGEIVILMGPHGAGVAPTPRPAWLQ